MSLVFIKVGGHLVQARNIHQEITVKTNHSGAPGEKAIGRSWALQIPTTEVYAAVGPYLPRNPTGAPKGPNSLVLLRQCQQVQEAARMALHTIRSAQLK